MTEWAGLEIRKAACPLRGFESLSLRFKYSGSNVRDNSLGVVARMGYDAFFLFDGLLPLQCCWSERRNVPNDFPMTGCWVLLSVSLSRVVCGRSFRLMCGGATGWMPPFLYL